MRKTPTRATTARPVRPPVENVKPPRMIDYVCLVLLGIVVLVVVWLVLFGLGCRWFMPHPRRVVLVGVLSLAAWLVAVLVAR